MSLINRIPLAMVVTLWTVAVFLGTSTGLQAEPKLLLNPSASGEIVLLAEGAPGHSHRIETSTDLLNWSIIAAQKDTPNWSFTDGLSFGLVPRKHYRMVQSVPPDLVPHESWKSAIALPRDAFLSPPISGTGSQFEATEVRWIKFALIVGDLPRVVFQDSAPYSFHYQFATERLEPFLGISFEDFNALSLHRDDQEVILGAVLWAPSRNEFGIQFVGRDPIPAEELHFLYETVDAAITRPEDATGFYMPTFEQTATAESQSELLAAHGIEVSAIDRWFLSDGCYTRGWALGRLVFVPGEDIEEAYRTGVLLPTDILLTDGVPAEVPFVAGIISTSPAPPNSHVAILAQSFGVPFVYLADEAQQSQALSLVGQLIVLRVDEDYLCRIRLIDAQNASTAMVEALLDLKSLPPVELVPMAEHGNIAVTDLTNVVPEEIGFIGGKASNFGFLRRTIPSNSPDAMAFTFDLWNAYLDQPVPPEGRTLRAEIELRLTGVSWPPNLIELEPVLDDIRDLIKDSADFTPAQKPQILAALTKFDPMTKLRFRSSTNAEDSDAFIGAGLYDSFSGCIADDTDNDEIGPSHCDPNKPNERGVFRAMRKVYASFYNTNAFLERLRRGVNESEVGMALLVHPSFPDEIEAANGVATTYSVNTVNRSNETEMVSQLGAVSVTNPEGGSLAEVMKINEWRGNFNGISFDHKQRSSLLQLGQDQVMNYQDDYRDFNTMFVDLVIAYETHFPDKVKPLLEFEFKKLTDDSLVIKQMREVPAAKIGESETIALFETESPFEIFQGENGTVFGNHRLKSQFLLRSDERWLDRDGLADSFITAADWQHVSNGGIITRSGSPASWPAHTHTVTPSTQFNPTRVSDTWQFTSQGGLTTYEMEIHLAPERFYKTSPIRTLEDFTIYFLAHYENPLPTIDFQGETTTTQETVNLVPGSPDDPLAEGSLPQTRHGETAGVEIDIDFYWPPMPTGIVAGYTAHLEKWDKTVITGLTAEPITLRGYYSQTYRPGHHNFTEEFIFEPRLEEGISAAQIQELETQNIRQIYVEFGFVNPVFKVLGADGIFRDL